MQRTCLHARPPFICHAILSRSLGFLTRNQPLSFRSTSFAYTPQSLNAQKTVRSPRFPLFTLNARPSNRYLRTSPRRINQRSNYGSSVAFRALVVAGALGLGLATYHYVEPVRHLILALGRSTRIAVSNKTPVVVSRRIYS